MEALVEIMKKMQPELSEEYISQGYGRAILIGVIMAALVIFATITTKQAKGLGITAGILQIAGALGAHLWVVYFSRMEMLKKITAPTQEQLDQMVSDYYAENIPKILLYCLGMVLVILAAVMLLIFTLKLMKVRPKILSVFAFILVLLRLVFFAPINTFNLLSQATEATQRSWDIVTIVIAIIPALLVGVVGLVSLIGKTPAMPEAPAVTAEESSEATAEEASAE